MKEKRFVISKSGLTPEQIEKRKKIKRYVQIISAVLFIAAMAGITYLLYPIFQGMGEEGWTDKVRERLSGYSGLHGLVVFFVIQIMQVVIAVIPAIQAVGGILYGWFFGGIASFVGIVLGSMLVWGIVKWLGAPLVESMVSEKHMKKFGFLDDEHKLIIILIILYLIPGIPKDVLTYIVPLTKVKFRDFFLYVMPFRIPAIFLTTALGNSITKGNIGAAVAVLAVSAVIIAVGFFVKKKLFDRIEKRKKHKKENANKQ